VMSDPKVKPQVREMIQQACSMDSAAVRR